jgi:hypothetical protein
MRGVLTYTSSTQIILKKHSTKSRLFESSKKIYKQKKTFTKANISIEVLKMDDHAVSQQIRHAGALVININNPHTCSRL